MATGLLTACLLLALAPPARADLGKPVVPNQLIGPYMVSVFISPEVRRVGPVEVSVLIQSPGSGKTIVNVPVLVTAFPGTDRKQAISSKASVANSTNQLLLAAVLDIPEPGKWTFEVKIEDPNSPGQIRIPNVVVEEPLPAWLNYAGWVLWPVGVIALFIVHRVLVRWRQRKALGPTIGPVPNPRSPKPRKARK